MQNIDIMKNLCELVGTVHDALTNEIMAIDDHYNPIGDHCRDCFCDKKSESGKFRINEDYIRVDDGYIHFIISAVKHCIKDKRFIYRFAQDWYIQPKFIEKETV